MYGRSTPATPVTRHVPLILTVLVSAAIHVLLLAAGWAFIQTNEDRLRGSSALSLMLAPAASSPAQPLLPVAPDARDTPDTSDTSDTSDSSEPTYTSQAIASPAAEPGAVAEQIVTTTAADNVSALSGEVVNNASNAASQSQSAPRSTRHSDLSVQAPPPRRQLTDTSPPARRMLNPSEQAQVQQVLEQLAARDTLTLTESGETVSLPDGSQVAVEVRAVTVPGLTDLARYEVALTQRRGGQLLTTRAILRERAFSWYAKFIHRWDTNVVLASDQVIGRFHSNSTVNFSTDRHRQPVFFGPVSLADYQAISRRLRSSGMFRQGINTGTGRIPMPDAVVPTVFTLAEQSLEVHRFAEHTRLEFLADGGFAWFQSESRAGVVRPAAGNAILIVADEVAVLELSGIVSGVVSVFAPRRLTIIGSLTYAADVPDGDVHSHYLTLISNGIIEVASPAQTGPGDLEIQAAVFARQRFSVRRFNSRPQGELIVRGTLIAGSVSATEPRYTTRIEYDTRFESVRPPAFPTTGLFDVAEWDEHWRITDAPAGSHVIDPGTPQPLAIE